VHRVQQLYSQPEAQDAQLIRRHAGMLERCARRLSQKMGNDAAYDDLWSVGALGLLEAARRFDPARDIRFESFAEHRVKGAMLDELRRMDHLPRRLRSDVEGVGKAKREVAQAMGREATHEEVAKQVGLGIDEVAELELLLQPPVELTPELPLASHAPTQDEIAMKKERAAGLAAHIGQLTERLQMVLSLVYVEELTYKEVAQLLKVSEPRVSQLHTEALKKLRAAMADPEGATVGQERRA
jgi:RNA polymerase sigma factor for flagellar operon FliA